MGVSLKCGLLPPLKGEGDRRRRRWWRGCLPSIAAGGRRGLSHLTVRTVPKYVRLRSLFWNGGGEINPFPEFYGNRRLALRDNSISPPLSGVARVGLCPTLYKGAALDLLGLCPRPRWGAAPNPASPFLRKKGLIPKTFLVFIQFSAVLVIPIKNSHPPEWLPIIFLL